MFLSQGDVQYAKDHGVAKLGEDVRSLYVDLVILFFICCLNIFANLFYIILIYICCFLNLFYFILFKCIFILFFNLFCYFNNNLFIFICCDIVYSNGCFVFLGQHQRHHFPRK